MSMSEHGAGSRIETLQEEIGIHEGLERRFLGRAATAAANGNMDEFHWAMDTSREAGEHAAYLSAIVRAESNARLRSLAMHMIADRTFPSFPAIPLRRTPYTGETPGSEYDAPGDRHLSASLDTTFGLGASVHFDEDVRESLRRHMEGSNPIILIDSHTRPYHTPGHVSDILDGMIAHRPEDFPGPGDRPL